MGFLRRIGVDTYMILLVGMVVAGALLPVSGPAARLLTSVTYWAVALLFFLYGAKLDPSTVLAGLTNWRLQGLVFLTTYLVFPVFGVAIGHLVAGVIPAGLILGLLFLSILPSTVQSSIAFTSVAGGNVAGAICAASVSNLIGVVLTPVLAAFLLARGGGEISMDAVMRLVVQILLPFAAGQAVRPWLGGWITRHKLATMIVDRGSILLIVYSAFSAGTVSGLWRIVPPTTFALLMSTIIVYLAIVMGTMVLLGQRTGLPPADRFVLFFCGSTKSLASGLPIATALFPAEEVSTLILPVMLFHLTQLLTCAVIAQRAARHAPA
jgi:sodium/bile acid cotransporter 7